MQHRDRHNLVEERPMSVVKSADGTVIAFERLGGAGDPVIVVGGALCSREQLRPLAEALSARCTVINYDRRGRGESGDTAPYAVEREVEDIAALIAEVGGVAAVYGHSSGAALVLHAAVHGLPMTKIVLHEPPFGPDDARQRRETEAHIDAVAAALERGARREAVGMHLSGTGIPQEIVDAMTDDPRMQAIAHTLLYDYAALSHRSRGGATVSEFAEAVTAPLLAITGGASPGWMIDTARRVADAVPNGRHVVIEGQGHVVPPELLVPVLIEFLH
jgi:alpha-beta hydrolase superfamily lysophospholipase